MNPHLARHAPSLHIVVETSVNSGRMDVYDLRHLSLASKGCAAIALRVARECMVLYDSTRYNSARYNGFWVPLAPVALRCPFVRELRCTKTQLEYCLTGNLGCTPHNVDDAMFPPRLRVLYVDAKDNHAETCSSSEDPRAFSMRKEDHTGLMRSRLRMVLPDGLQEFYWKNDSKDLYLPKELPPGLRVLDCMGGRRETKVHMPRALPHTLRVLRVRPVEAVSGVLDMVNRLPLIMEVCDVA